VIVFVSYKPDKRTKFYKFLSKQENIKIEEHKFFNEKQLIIHLKENFPLTDSLAHYVIERT